MNTYPDGLARAAEGRPLHYLVTGHTGFKGAWLALMLRAQGHTVSGLSLDPIPGSLFESARVGDDLRHDLRIDIRRADETADAVRAVAPDVVVHLAAQALVRESYRDPRTTFETNVMGTLNLLDAVQTAPTVRAHLVVTTDKVYQNVGREAGYREDEALGAGDPYSSSKAMADILAQSWVRSFAGPPTAVVRGGNVIGGGDVSQDRLLPDLVRAFEAGDAPVLRYPAAVRPWQHVLDCLAGYQAAIDHMLTTGEGGEWNIGPGPESFVPVGEVADAAASLWGPSASWTHDDAENPHEATLLALDATKARTRLGWANALRFPLSLQWVIAWHRAVFDGADPRAASLDQIERFLNGDIS